LHALTAIFGLQRCNHSAQIRDRLFVVCGTLDINGENGWKFRAPSPEQFAENVEPPFVARVR